MNNELEMPTLATRKIQVGGRSIHLAEAGQGPAVLMLHGGGPGASGVSNYTRNIAALARHFRVLVPDMPGYGQSTKGINRSDPFGDLAGSMAGLLDTLQIGSAHLIGNSLGGACALRLALDHPDRAARLVLMGPGGVGTTRALPTPGLNRLFDYYNGDGPSMEKLTRFIRGDLVYDGTKVSAAVIAERYRSSVDPEVIAAPPLRRPKGWPSFRKLDFTRDPRLQQCDTPTLVLWGTEDKVNRPSGASALQQRMRRCDVHLFSETGHWVQWERAAQFNAVTTAFLLEHGAGQQGQP